MLEGGQEILDKETGRRLTKDEIWKETTRWSSVVQLAWEIETGMVRLTLRERLSFPRTFDSVRREVKMFMQPKK